MAKLDQQCGAIHAEHLDGSTAQAARHGTMDMRAGADPFSPQGANEQADMVADISRHGQAAPHTQALCLGDRGEAQGEEAAIRIGEVAGTLGAV
jgi:hypothetical protein